MSSIIHTTPTFLKALGNLAKENQVSNKEFKAKLAHKANRVKQLQRQRKIADQMDKELTKLEKNAAKEQAKQDKMDAKQAKIAEKETKKQAKEAKIAAKIAEKEAKKQAKEAKKQAKEAKIAANEAKKQTKETKIAEKQAKKLARVVTTDTDSDESFHNHVEKVVVAPEKTVKKTVAKKQSNAKAENNDRMDIIRSICEQLDAAHIHENHTVIV